jgi:hypothetical protein
MLRPAAAASVAFNFGGPRYLILNGAVKLSHGRTQGRFSGAHLTGSDISGPLAA